jgi:UDPglucose 6-dehydrogenase
MGIKGTLTSPRKKAFSISILGSGTVGMNIGKGLVKLGNRVVFYDNDPEKVNQLLNCRFDATRDIRYTIANSDVSFICVPTPTVSGKIDLSYLKSVVSKLSRSLKEKKNYHLVVLKSTVLPTTAEDVVIPLLNRTSGKKVGADVGLCCNPEFLTEIHHTWTDDGDYVRSFFNEPFIVIGEFDEKSGDLLESIYEPLEAVVVRTDLKTAEMIKYSFNCALACRISYWNEIFQLCRRLGIDSDLVASTAGMDKRIGKYGTVHGKAFGGKCLPKDLKALIGMSERLGYEPELLKAVERINMKMASEFGVRE